MRIRTNFKIGAMAIMAMLLLSFSSCGGNKTESTTETTGQPAATPGADAPAGDAQDAVGDLETLVGTFIGIEYGDYAHFMVKDEQGGEHSFFMAGSIPPEQVTKFEGADMKGKKVEVKWHKTTADIPEAGGKMEIEEVVEIKEI